MCWLRNRGNRRGKGVGAKCGNGLLSLLLSLSLSLLLNLLPGLPCTAATAAAADTAAQVLALARAHALHKPSAAAEAALMSAQNPHAPDTIRAFLASFDPWATWQDAEEQAQAARTRAALGGSAGLDLVRNRRGELVCLPYPDSPAWTAGLREGDVLRSVDGYSVADADLDDVAVLVMGTPGTSVRLAVRRGQEAANSDPNGQHGQSALPEFSVTRGKVRPPNVRLTQNGGVHILRVYRFNRETPAAFDAALKKAGTGPLVLDVRGNSGGLLSAALACASRLLPAHAVACVTRTAAQSQRKRTTRAGSHAQAGPLAVWHDSLTASSAEVFVAALTDNGRAVSLGETTYGKARVQETFTVNGHRLALTTEALARPTGSNGGSGGEPDQNDWNDRGLRPQVPCPAHDEGTLLQKTLNILR